LWQIKLENLAQNST